MQKAIAGATSVMRTFTTMTKEKFIDLVSRVAVFTSLCFVVLLSGYYLGFSESHEFRRQLDELNGIRFNGGNPYRDRALGYGLVAILLLASAVLSALKAWVARICGLAVMAASLFPVWSLFISIPAVLLVGTKSVSSYSNFIQYLDFSVLPVVVFALVISVGSASLNRRLFFTP